MAAATIAQYARSFPILQQMSSPRNKVELLETVGKGNYGYVYKGRLVNDNKIAAIKVVYLKEDELRETLLEMEMLQRCQHPNITRFLGSYLKGLDFWICMEYCGGGALDSIYRCTIHHFNHKALKNPLTEDELACILYDTAQALDYLHTEVAIIHRDIKAGNLLLTDDGCLKLADFGVSAQLSGPHSSAQTFIGTPYWMAPEVILLDPDSNADPSTAYTTKADIWSLGITAIEIAEKNPPLADIHPMRALQLIPSSDLGFSKPKLWSKQLLDFVSVCLTKDPSKRPTASQLLNHPFLERVKSLDREQTMKDLIFKARKAKERAKLGKDEDDDEKEDEEADDLSSKTSSSNPSTVIAGTLQHARDVIMNNPLVMMRRGSSTTESSLGFVNTDVPNLIQSFTTEKLLDVVNFGRMDVGGADILDGQYLLLGNTHGLFFVDLHKEAHNPVCIIRDMPFHQLAVLEDYSVLLAISGRHSHIRQYRLSSIRKLIRYLSGTKAERLANIDLSYLSADKNMSDSLDRQDLIDEYYQSIRNAKTLDDEDLILSWRSDYVKVVGSRDTKSFVIQRTFSSVFLAGLVKQDVIVYQWASEPYSQFLKLKAFWLPEKPKFLRLIHDGISVKQICIGYQNEANLVKIDDSNVLDIQTHRAFREKTSVGWKSRWRDFSQIPFSKTKAEEVKQLASSQSTVNRKLLAATTLKRPSNHNMECYFLATFDRVTFVTDSSGSPLIGKGVAGWKDGVLWEGPVRQLLLRHGEYVIAVTNSSIELNDWNSSICNHKINFPVDGKLCVLSDRVGGLIVKLEQKRRKPFIYWIKEKAPPKIHRKEDIIKPAKMVSPIQIQMVEVDKMKDSSETVKLDNFSPEYNTSERRETVSQNNPSNGLSVPAVITGSVENAMNTDFHPSKPLPLSKQEQPSTVNLGKSTNAYPERKTFSRRNISTLSTDEYIRMRNQYASSTQHAQAILTRPIINAYNQPYSQHSYGRPRPSISYGIRNVPSLHTPFSPQQSEQAMYMRQFNASGSQPQYLPGNRPMVVMQRRVSPDPDVDPFRPPSNNNLLSPTGHQSYNGLPARSFYANQAPYPPQNIPPYRHQIRPSQNPNEFAHVQNNGMNGSTQNSFSHPQYGHMVPYRQEYSTPNTNGQPLNTPERRQSLSLRSNNGESVNQIGNDFSVAENIETQSDK